MSEDELPAKKSPVDRIRRLGGSRSKRADDGSDEPTTVLPATAGDTESAEVAPASGAPASTSGHRHMSAATTRRVLAAVAIGAIVAAIATIFFTGGFKKDKDLAVTPVGQNPAATGAVAGEAFGSAAQGDCLTWKKPDASDLGKVDCAEPHLFEVASEVDLSKYPGAEFGPGAKFPGVLRFSELRDEHCAPAVNRYLGAKFDPNGKFDIGLINPGEAGWAAGERTLRCGLQYSGTTGALMPIVGPVVGQDQSKVFDPGTCIGINQNIPADPVECSQQHAFEVVGTVDLAVPFPGGPPSPEDQDKFIEGECTKTSNAYLGSPDVLRNKTLTLFWDNLDASSWLAGSRRINCSVGKEVDTGGFAPLVNSAKGDILINGQPPVPPPAIPNGRSMPAPLPGAAPAPIPPADAPVVPAPPG